MGVVFSRVAQPCQPSPVPRPDRPAHRPFRGLLSVHSRCGLHTRTVTVCRDRYPKASDTSSPPCLLRSLPAGAVAGWGLHPLEKRRLVTAHVENCHWLAPDESDSGVEQSCALTKTKRPNYSASARRDNHCLGVIGITRPPLRLEFSSTTPIDFANCATPYRAPRHPGHTDGRHWTPDDRFGSRDDAERAWSCKLV